MSRRLPFACLLSALAVLACASPVMASTTQESFFQDDRVLTNSDYSQQALALDGLKRMGVDSIHTVVNWNRFAPKRNAKKKPKGFDGRDPKAYGATNWNIYDSLVRGAAARGIAIQMSPSGPVPRWASKCKHNKYSACRPDPKLYRDFVTALAKRYSGKWVDEDQEQTALPRVTRWSPWNEPNLGVWLWPQTKGKRGHRVYIGAAYYRKLVYAARAALDATGHRSDMFLVGETAPLGGGATRTPPADFLRGLFCLNERGKRARGQDAKDLGCLHAKRIRASGISHHPYGRGAGVPTGRKQRAGAITIGTIGRFVPILRAARRYSRVAPRSLGVYITEFGVTTRPPDRKFGVPLNRQAEYLNLVDYLAFQRPWIKSVSQYQLVDDTGLAVRGTFQTGLIFRTNVLKPSFQAYRLPIFVVRVKKGVKVFGQVRPVKRGTAKATVDIQNKQRGKPWKTLRTLKTNPRGYVFVRVKQRNGFWRIRWVEPDGTISYSRGSASVPGSTPSTPGLPPPGTGTPPPPQPPTTDPGSPPPAPEEPPAAPPPVQYTLSVTLEGKPNSLDVALMRPGGGKVTSSPPGIDCGTVCAAQYNDGTAVTLTPVPDTNSTFSGWTGEGCSGTGTCTVPMSQARSVKATFTRNFP